jgi:hypothetical protein
MQAHQDALEACRRVLDDHPVGEDVGYVPEASTPLDASVDLETSASRVDEGLLYRVALEEVRTILVGASEDVRTILEEEHEGGVTSLSPSTGQRSPPRSA